MRLIKPYLLFFLGLSFFLSFKLINAQETEICDGSGGECHYLRPYPAEPFSVSTSELASYCGSDITISQTIIEHYDPKDPNCKVSGNKISCSYTKTLETPITIDLKNANLPIMGNTEDVKNTINEEDKIDNSEKVNEYVSWYLSGTNFKKEYGFPNPTENLNQESQKELLNYSGPLAKLLPQEIQLATRIETVEREAGKDVNEDGNTPPQDRHDQTVVCTKIGLRTTPTECSNLSVNYKISEWEKDLSDWRTLLNSVLGAQQTIIDVFFNIIPGYTQTFIEDFYNQIEPWNKRVPPLSWDKKHKDDPLLYKKHYNEWRGKSCIIIPIPKKFLVCTENFLIPNKWADLFSYIPLSSTEDTKGQVKIDSPNFTNQSPANLFFAHIEEAGELASSLQDTFVYKDGDKTGTPTLVEQNPSCNQVEVRSNKGDNLFAGEISGNLRYNATYTCDYQFQAGSHDPKACLVCSGKSCIPNPNKGTFCNQDFNECDTSSDCTNLPGYITDDTCTKTVHIQLSTKSYTPKADNLWSQLVSGPTSIFKKIFPKLGTEIGTLKDIAGSTSVDVSGSGVNSTGELKFPHLGGISEYFLKGIQTALRPKGYGEPISFGATLSTGVGSDCDQSVPDQIPTNGTMDKETLAQNAPPGNRVMECYNDVVKRSKDAGISPAFTLLLWLNESGCSSNPAYKDFGDLSAVGFSDQFDSFLDKPSYYKDRRPDCFGGSNDTDSFFGLFLPGTCNPGDGKPYMELFERSWSWITDCPETDWKYPFKSSCF